MLKIYNKTTINISKLAMAKFRMSNGKKKNGIVKLKDVAEKLQKSLLLVRKSNYSCNSDEEHEQISEYSVPEDVKEGHFAVIAVYGEKIKRFVVPLTYLTNPSFVRLLEQAAEEYGFNQEGALTLPCHPNELEKMLSSSSSSSSSSTGEVNYWSSCNKSMVQSY